MIELRRWIWLGAALLIAVLLYLLHNILSPFLVGILLAYLADPLVDRLSGQGCREPGAWWWCSACSP